MGRGTATSLVALGLAATVALFTAPVQAQVSFITAQTYAGGGNSVTVGDLDGDGDLDLATANINSDNVSVLKNNGNGTFAAPQYSATGDGPSSITVGDLDGDGDLDLATANSVYDRYSPNPGSVSVLKNNGNGTFAAPQNFAAGNASYSFSITIGDLDGDGDLDLATLGSELSVLKNNGDGTFAAPQTFAGGGGSITVGDLDGDGDLDLATAIRSGSDFSANVFVFKNNGDGTFAAAQGFFAGDYPYSITVGDLDGDGDLDLATANSSTNYGAYRGSVSVLKNNGNGTFASVQNFTGSSRSITIGDLDKDGDLDLATANYLYDTVSVLKNNGNGTFATAQTFAIEDGASSITVGDLDGDSDLDLATDGVSVLKNNGDGTLAAPQKFATGDYSNSITVGDLDGDGDLDLVTTTYGLYASNFGAVSVLKNNGNGTFAAPQGFDTGDPPYSITVGDLDEDGDLDLATANRGSYPDYTNTASVLKNNGNGTFAAPQTFATGDYSNSITVGDLDGDGDLDLATANVGSVSVLKNNGNGTFATPQTFATGEGSYSITVGDLDGDGDLDLATANSSGRNYYIGTVSVLKNNGNGTFTAPQTLAVGDSSGSGRSSFITIGDLDGDSDLDLATANNESGNTSVLKNNGNGTFASAQNFTGSGRSITIGDLDKDGDLDLATSTVLVLENSTPTLQLSPSPSRVNPVPLAGESVSGTIYVFASGENLDFLRVQFYLDDADRSGEPIRLERSAPFDFAGGTNMDPTLTQAKPFDTSALSNGQHTITATFARTDGTFRTITSTFTVSN